MIVVGDPKSLRKASAFVEKFEALVEEFGYAVPAASDSGVVFEFGERHPGGGSFAVVVVPADPDLARYGLGLGSEA